MVGFTRLHLACSAALLGTASTYGIQQPMAADDSPIAAAAAPVGEASKRPLVSSKALQDTIKGEHLLRRAKNLYEIAKLGEDEYNHPTRVIGSDGL